MSRGSAGSAHNIICIMLQTDSPTCLFNFSAYSISYVERFCKSFFQEKSVNSGNYRSKLSVKRLNLTDCYLMSASESPLTFFVNHCPLFLYVLFLSPHSQSISRIGIRLFPRSVRLYSTLGGI